MPGLASAKVLLRLQKAKVLDARTPHPGVGLAVGDADGVGVMDGVTVAETTGELVYVCVTVQVNVRVSVEVGDTVMVGVRA